MGLYAPPHPALRGLVAGDYHAGAEILAPGESIAVPASLTMAFNLNLGEAPTGFPTAYAAGPGRLYRYGTDAAAPAPVTWIGLRLTPLGAYTVLGTPLDVVGGHPASLDEVFGAAGRVLTEQCRAAGTAAQCFALLDAFLLRRAAAGPRPDPETVQAWRRLSVTGGRVRVSTLAAEAGWSSDHLTRVFRRQVGMPPKVAGRLVRLRRLLRQVDPQQSQWPRLAAEHGYSDQPHFNRDMREFTGLSPSAYFSRLRSCGCLAGSDSSKTAPARRS